MKLFEMKEFTLSVTDEAWGITHFKTILKRDKNRTKETAFKEMLFIYHYTDVRSDYVYIINDKERCKEIVKDVGLPIDWKIDNIIQDAINYYNSMSLSPIAKLYKSSLKAADDISRYLESTDKLLKERTVNGGVVNTLATITGSLKSVPIIMKDLKAAYKEVLLEQKDMDGKTKGSRSFGLFEDGLNID